MRASEFYLQWIKRAFSGRLALAEFVSGLFSIIALPLWYKWEAPVEYLNWFPFYVFATVFVGTVVYGFVRAPVDLHKEALLEIAELKLTIEDREAIQKALNELWGLRKKGVEIRNECINKPEDLQEWGERYNQWLENVYLEAGKISKNLEQWLRILDQVKQGTVITPALTEQVLDLKVLSEILHRLQRFLEKDLIYPSNRQY